MSLSAQGNATQYICEATESALKPVDIEKSLIEEANGGDATGTKAILKHIVNPIVKDELGLTPLHNMCKRGNIAIAKLLLDYGADQDAKDGSNLTPLHYAAQEGHSEIVELLLRFRADPQTKDNSGSIPLDYAAKDDIKQLLENGGYAEITTEEAGVGQATQKPIFPIRINGNNISQSIGPAKDASEANYILIQTRKDISDAEKDILQGMNLEFYDCICENTYLCRYEPDDLEIIRQKGFIAYVDVYRQEFKICANLKMEMKTINSDEIIEAVLIFHDASRLDVENMRAEIVKKNQNRPQRG
ncbi:ANK_REP_REGION domain-containing protein [Trichoderma simmonsii]|uniref:ANK_REP_REGION domain-containing protein n=1 Tax=Trichoderma simmonsii TaxID=1491479 RepID=A0A8G0LQ41_9HYPO|nr:ANK_REP_REGION domain-containing protein [Trichoderma simmonsii]